MCLISCRSPQTEPDVVPNRPIQIPVSSTQLAQPTPEGPRGSRSSQISLRPLSARSYGQQIRLDSLPRRQSQVIVIEQQAPRSSGVLPAQPDREDVFSSGSMAVIRKHSQSRQRSPENRDSSNSVGMGTQAIPIGQSMTRRSGSLLYGRDPRASNASWRSTRERIVVVDGQGIRREYIR